MATVLTMDDYPDLQLDPIRRQLFETKLGSLATWRIPSIVRTVGPHEPEVFEAFDERRRELAGAVVDRLRNYSHAEIKEITDGKFRDQPITLTFWRSFLREPIERLRTETPPWYAGGFGHPDYAAEFEYWCRMPSFSVPEVTILSVGVEPKHLMSVLEKDRSPSELEKLWPALRFLHRRFDQLRRKFDPASARRKLTPKDFLRWVEMVDFEVHPEFLDLLMRYHSDPKEPGQSHGARKNPDQREIDKIAQLFTAMVIEYYGYRPDQSRSPVPREIVELAASMGLEVSDDTVRKYLRMGAAFISKDWSPNSR